MSGAKVNICFLAAAVMMVWPCGYANATVSSLAKAQSYQMFAPADTVESGRPKHATSYRTEENRAKYAAQKAAQAASEDVETEIAINYNRIIAQKLLSKANDDVMIGVNSKRRKISVPLGKDLTIKLIEENNQTCTYECNDKILKYERGSKEGNELSIVFNAENLGRSKLYVDCITNVPGEGIKVHSKVFNISVD